MRKTDFLVQGEVKVFFLRIYAADKPPPAEYLFCVLAIASQGSVSIEGLATDELKPAHCAAIFDYLKAKGYHTIQWSRRNPLTGEMKTIIVNTGVPKDLLNADNL